jgi:site-specific recombinase XerD
MGQLRERMEADLKLAGYSPSTKKIYLLYARLFAKHFMRSPEAMGETEVRAFMLHLVEGRRISAQTYRQVRAALRFLYFQTLQRPVDIEWLPARRLGKPLPLVLSGTEVEGLLAAVRSPKYRAILMVLYGGGLRISEACRLRPGDIDSKRMVIRVQAGKGAADRYTLLSRRLLGELRDYWKLGRPEGGWLFPGNTKGGHVSPESTRKVFHRALIAAGISKEVSPHVLRHCFATHLIESGVDVTVVQALLGHASLRATCVYTHINVEHIGRTKSPLDLLGSPAGRIFG